LILLAIDPSIVKSGWAIFDNGVYVASGVIKTKRSTKLSETDNLNTRLSYINIEITKIIELYAADAIIIEDQFLRVNVKALKTLVASRVCLAMAGIVKGLRIDYVQPSVWQSYCFGGKKVPNTKIASVAYAATYKESITDDEADAICIGVWFSSGKTS